MAERFVVDIDKAQQVGQRLTSIGQAIANIPPGPQPRGTLGTGIIERAVSEFERAFTTARQNLTQTVNSSASGFQAVASGTTQNDQQQSQQAQQIGTT